MSDRSQYWQTPPQKRVTLTVRVPEDVKEHLEGVIQLWRILAKLNHSDPEQVTLTYVVERMLRVGVDGVWAQAGAQAGLDGMPRTPEEWQALEAALLKKRGRPEKK